MIGRSPPNKTEVPHIAFVREMLGTCVVSLSLCLDNYGSVERTVESTAFKQQTQGAKTLTSSNVVRPDESWP